MPLIRSALRGSDAASGTLQLISTSNATKGKILLGTTSAFDEANSRLGINTQSPGYSLEVVGTGRVSGTLLVDGSVTTGTITADKYVKPYAQLLADAAGITNNVTLANVGISATVIANTKYEVRGTLIYSAGAGSDIKVDVTGPANFGCDLTAFGIGASVASLPGAMVVNMLNASPSNATFGGIGAGVKITAFFHGHLYSGDGGTVNIRAAQGTTGATATVVHANTLFLFEAFN